MAGDTSEHDHQVDPSTTGAVGHLSDSHLLLDVPHYDGSASDPPRTYLRLGSSMPGSYGDDMLTRAGVTAATEYYFKDDYREKNGQTHPNTVYTRWDGHSRQAVSAVDLTNELLTRGGWRLHTDGNYISTTRGDRVDVIYGNYKLVVLGRVAPGDFGETYWESSGGHTRWATNTQGDMVMVEWQTDRWRTYEETIKGHSIERFQGISEEITESPIIVSLIGSKDAASAASGSTAAIPASDKSDAPATPAADGSNAAGPHTQTDQATQWINPSSGSGAGRPRKQVKPAVSETIRAKTISETTTVTRAQGSAPLPAGFTKVVPVSDAIRAVPAGGHDPLKGVSGDPFGATSGSPWAGHAPAGTISSYTVVTDSKKEFMGGGLVFEATSAAGGVTVHEESGFAPPTIASVADRNKARRIDHVGDCVFALCKFSIESYDTRTVQNFGGWTLNCNLVALAIDISLGAELTTPNFDAPTFGRFQFSVDMSGLVLDGSCSLLKAGVLVGGSMKFATTTVETKLGPESVGGVLVKIGATVAKVEAKVAAQEIEMIEIAASGRHVGT